MSSCFTGQTAESTSGSSIAELEKGRGKFVWDTNWSENTCKSRKSYRRVRIHVHIRPDRSDKSVKFLCSIVFVHGLNGHQEDTWRHASTPMSWPAAFLSNGVPRARILAYGYDARVADWHGFLNKVAIYGIQHQSQTLLETLASHRADQEASQRPIFFVAHSLGGIICKKALVDSQIWAAENHIGLICRSTRGIIFLGTPHSGAVIANFASTLARAIGLIKHTNSTNLRELRKGSHELKKIQEDFDQHLRSRGLYRWPPVEVKCFYETKPVTGIGVVVDYESAVLAGNIPVGINKDHREMTKFESPTDSDYKLIEFTIQRWLKEQQQAANIPYNTMPLCDPGSPVSNAMATPTQITSSYERPEGPRSSSSESSTGPSFVKIPPGGNFILNERLVKLPFVHVPSILSNRQSKYFQSRNVEMEHVEAALFPAHLGSEGLNSLNHRICTITGLGGIGKTELSFRFFNKFKDDLDAVFFVVADSESRLREEYSQIALRLGLLGSYDHKDLETSSEAFRLWLADPIRGIPDSNTAHATVKWLLVYDNVESTDTLEKFWPAGNSGKILITSRNPLITPRGLFSSTPIRLEGLPTSDAVQLLQVCSNDDRNDAQSIEDATQIVEWVKGLPMAVKQLGSIIFDEHMTISQFRRVWSTKHKLMGRLRDAKGSEGNLATVWALENLYESHRDSFELLGVLSMLDPELIPHELLTMSSRFSASHDPSVNEASYIASRKHLADTSLIDVSRETGDLRIHRLVQDLVRDFIIRIGQAATFFNKAIGFVVSVWPFLNRNYVTGTATNVDRWGACHRFFPHILHLRDVHEDWSNAGVGVAITTELPELLLEAVQYCNERGAGHDAIALVETADNIYRNISFEKPLETTYETRAKVCRARIGLAVSAREGDDVFEFAQQAFEIENYRHRDKETPSSILAVAYNDLATGWAFRREWNTAIELLAESKKIRERLPGFTRDKLFSPLYHLGIVYHHQGNFDAAETTLKQAIEDRSALFGPEDTRSVRSAALYYALGNMRLDRADRRCGDLMKALGDFKIAVAIATVCMGARNRTTLLCQYQVARASMMLQDYATARDLLDEVLTHSIDSSMYERDTARMAYYYAHCLEVQGMRKESLVWFNKALSIHNRKRTQYIRTLETLTEADIEALIPYDFL
ncbi:hypothetical protein O1611_g748 [Lasiodiplodia mahajangana]|uniref:Uncharacterized protein n=1 Tax=Lasiodiplodia mahajangana TaxID=1108764 RepID=A0ACC2JZC9_9PEZI|nr:hypothetical protein O1611_g748 [Lasiodiplodia mahajangana]